MVVAVPIESHGWLSGRVHVLTLFSLSVLCRTDMVVAEVSTQWTVSVCSCFHMWKPNREILTNIIWKTPIDEWLIL